MNYLKSDLIKVLNNVVKELALFTNRFIAVYYKNWLLAVYALTTSWNLL